MVKVTPEFQYCLISVLINPSDESSIFVCFIHNNYIIFSRLMITADKDFQISFALWFHYFRIIRLILSIVGEVTHIKNFPFFNIKFMNHIKFHLPSVYFWLTLIFVQQISEYGEFFPAVLQYTRLLTLMAVYFIYRYGLWVFSNAGYFPKSGVCGGMNEVSVTQLILWELHNSQTEARPIFFFLLSIHTNATVKDLTLFHCTNQI